ncbi:non-ribosomal peptide synthase/polyketide synthase [Photorhabdus kleinii]|nr:non-ribosomal peptide synthase/polyketide synthase [Photorhabdus kleinii]MCT8343393.1 non-ribosomal peptide synthase/polyketide synthase [Photorhabdus kleinii]
MEPGEIEARLAEYPSVRGSAVLAQGDGSEKRLVAYVVADAAEGLVNSLRVYLSTVLPDYMVPAAFVRLDGFPLTSNGKLDRRALPAPDREAFARQRYEAPQGATETVLAAIWCELLGIEQISRHDNFFTLGGHSLVAVRAINRIMAVLGVELPLIALFNTPSLAAQAQVVQARLDKQDSVALPAIIPVSREGILPLSFAQQRLWFLAQLEGISETYHIPLALHLHGQLNMTAWQQALNTVFGRHEALRTVFTSVDGQPQVRLLAKESGLPLVQYDLRGHSAADTALEQLCTEAVSAPFELSRGPLIRAVLIRLADEDYQFLLIQHHIVSDGWSVNVLIRELNALYTAFLAGHSDPLSPLAIQYPDYAAWQHQWLSAERTQAQSDYWRTVLADAPVLLDLPTDRPRPPEQSFAGHAVPVHLDPELTVALNHLSNQHGVTLFMTLLAAWTVVLSRLSGQEDIIIGTPSAGRSRQEAEPLIGFFVNTLALRMVVPSELTVAECLTRVRETALAAQAHQDLPFEQVVEIVQPSRRLAHTPLFQVMFAWQNNEHTDWELPGLTVTPVDQAFDAVKFDLELELYEEAGGISGALNYSTSLFDRPTIERHRGYLQTVLQAMVANAQQKVGEMDILAPAERRLLLETWNATETPYPETLCLHQLFEQQAEKTPDATALIYKNQTLSYAELNARANRLAHQLIALGVAPDQLVAICVSRSPAMVVALLAVLKAGGAYVPLDPAYPGERLAHILTDAASAIILADEIGRTALGDKALAGRKVLDPNSLPEQPDSNPQIAALIPCHLAYVIYTSGSTGAPKGVMVEHQALYQRYLGVNELYAVTAQDRVLQFSTFAFDVSVEECFSALCNGATLVMRDDGWLASIPEFIALARQNRITVMFLPTLFWSELAASEKELRLPDALRLIIIGSEAIKKNAIQDWFGQEGYRPRLLNAYGSTENTVTATCQEILSPIEDRSIGRPIKNTRIYLLDKKRQPVPLGCVGEIYIGGVGVARGYLNRPELTAERFLIDPFSDSPDACMYQTGDLGRYLPDGNLEFLGRNDQQVKIRGFRIEPGEIESCLSEYPAVRESALLAQGEGSDKRLVAYVVADAEEELVNSLRGHLSARLPDYMVPAAFVRLDSFPLTPNGKLDRRALPVPGEDAFARQIYAAPQGEIEIVLAAVWRELLGIEKISRYDNFFALGGHSLLAVRVMNRIMTVLGVELPLAVLFNSPSLAALAQVVQARLDKQDNAALPAILPVSRVGRLPLSFAQQRLWFLAQLEGISETYHIPLVLHLRGRLDITAWQQALNTVFARHEALRTVFVSVDGQPQVRLLAKENGVPLVQHDLRGHSEADSILEQMVTEAVSAPFELSRGPLIRAELIRLTDEDYQFLLIQHHIVSDGWSVTVLIRELNALYTAFLAGHLDPLPPLAIQYLDYADWQHQWLSAERTQAQSDYWRTVLADAPVLLDLPTDRPRPPEQSFVGYTVPVRLDPVLTAALKHVSQQHGVTLFMTLLSAWGVVLSRLSGQEDIIIGTPSAGRSRQEVEPLIGFFVNTLALRMVVSGELTVAECLTQVQETALAAQAHQDLPFEQVVEIVQPPRWLAHTPLFQVMFAWQNNERTDLELPGLIVSHVDQELDIVRFDLELNLFEEEGGIVGDLGYSAALFDQSTIERQVGYLHAVLQAMVANAQQKVGEIDILAPAERRLLLKTWNATETPYSETVCIHQLFEQQAEKIPDAIALMYEEQTLSYAELNARANRLAHQLIALGIAPDQLIVSCVSRSPAMVVGILAILKAGGAYVPLDPDYPGERLAQMLTDAAPAIVLADETGRAALGDKALTGRVVLDPNSLPELPDSNPQIRALTPRHLAYVIYTSGSTGTPKGVMVEHNQLVQEITVLSTTLSFNTSDRILQFCNTSFDVCASEIFFAMTNGSALILRTNQWTSSAQEFWSLCELYNVTYISIPVQFWRILADSNKGDIYKDLRIICIGGETIPQNELECWLSVYRECPVLVNCYGATEATITTTISYLNEKTGQSNLIGRPLPNMQMYLLDAYAQPVPLGSIGELYIGGVGVARGYLNRPELTAERFLADPFSDKPHARMYRTGDLGRYLPDGNLEFLGRNDQQVKIRGFRIELGEIEVRLTEHPAVRESVVLALEEGTDKRLMAYVVADASEELVDSLRAHLSAVLPDYMVPSAFVRLDAFPLTPNGKLDRKALPVPGEDAFSRQIYAAPQGEIETALVAIWCELLGIEKISRHDNFFALGGHSLLAVRVMNRIMAILGVELPLTVLFNSPSLAALAQAIQAWLDKQDSTVLPAILPVSREGKLLLSFAQQRLWFLAQLEGVSETYHIPLALHLRGRLDITAWQQALNTVFARHEALRTVFVSVNGQPQVRLLAKENGVPLVQHDLRGHPAVDTVLEQLYTEAVSAPFDLSREPLIRAELIRLTEEDSQFLLTQHHIVSDGWSVTVLIRELNALYTAFLAGHPDPLPPLVIQYPDYAAWQHQWFSAERTQVQTDYWQTVLADAPVLLDLPTDRPRPPEQSFAGHAMPVHLDPELTAALKQLGQQHGVTLFMTVLSAWAVVLSRLSSQEDIVIGIPSAGRSRQEVEPLIGFFVNTLALRLAVSGELTVTECLTRVRESALAAQAHQDLPFEQVVEIVQPPRRMAHTPLFQVMFAWQNNEQTDWVLPGLTVTPIDQVFDAVTVVKAVKYDLELELYENAGGISGALNYSTALFDRTTIERHIGYLQTVLQVMVTNAQQKVGDIDILAPAERRLLLETWNSTETPYPDAVCLHQLFEQQVQKTPDATALEYQGQCLSYAELNARANRLAHQLMTLGVAPDQLIAICVSRSPAMIVGILAILKAGGAYVPLDPVYPGERLAQILSDTASALVLADEIGRIALGDKLLAGREVLDPNACFDQPDSNRQIAALTPYHLAYVIYTSGSTGTPKGVMVEHQALYQRYLGVNELYAVTALDRVLQFSTFAFDVSVEECFSALCNGATLVIRDDDWLTSIPEFIALARQNRITVMFLPTLFWSELAASEKELRLPDALRLIIIGSEAIKKNAIQDWFRQEGYRPRLLNAYGPTENTVTATCQEILSPIEDRSIGRPIKNTRIYLLDKKRQPVPLGCVGEIYIGGVGVARGYLNRPELTAEHFLIDPFSDSPDARMYRTGDLACYLPDGNLEFLGRNDQQVKIRGFRIEPGEIEVRLMEHPAVRESVVLVQGDGTEKRLIAYVVAEVDEGLVNSLRSHLSAVLPDYMVPVAFVRLDSFPLTPNGKLDRKALPVPGEDAFSRQIYATPQGETETALASVWRELLGIEKISRHDNFFTLGGHSLLAVRMIEHLRHLGLKLAVRDLFQTPVLSSLAQRQGQYQAVPVPVNVIIPDTTTITPTMLPLIDLTQVDIDRIVGQVPGGMSNIQDIYALSPLQDGILFHHLLANEGDPYLLTIQMVFADRALLDRYLAAVQQVVNRHDILRTAFVWQGLSVPAQVVWRQATLSVTELALDPAEGPVSEQLSRRFDPRRYRLDLSEAPLLQFVIAREADGRWFLLELQHHLIGDHTTQEVMHHEIRAYLTGLAPTLSAPVPFRNLVAQARLGISQEEHTRFFTEMLADVVEPTLPFGLAEVHRDGSQVTEYHRMLSAELNSRLRRQARQLGVSLAALCHLAWAQVLSRTSSQENVVFGTVLFGRMAAGAGADSGLGLFVNTLPLRLDIDNTPVRESVQQAHTRLAGLLAHEHASLALAQRCSGIDNASPLFSALLNYRHNNVSAISDEGISGIEFVGGQERTSYPFVLSVEDFGRSLGLTAQTVQPFASERICGYMQQALESLAEALEHTPDMPVRALEILPEAERTLLLTTRNATETEYPETLCIHQLFEQQAEKTPTATALVYEEQTFSYAELNARANRLAHQLIMQGVEPDQLVALCVSRSPAMVVGVLAILKAGGAYVPLDPAYPGERLAHILTDAAPAIILADETGRTALGEKALAGRKVLDPNSLPEQSDSNPQIPALTSCHLAYVIYTSGSTGTPKGVMVEHRNILRLFDATESWYHFNQQDSWCLFHSIAFDFSVWELWGALRYGAKLVLVPHAITRSPQEFHQFVCQHGITVLNQTPSAFKAFIANYVDNPSPDQLRYIIFGGEALDPSILKPWYRLRKDTSPQLVNMYGITETTVHVTYRVLNHHDVAQTVSPIGTRIPDLTLYLLDKYGQPVPEGVTGELYIGGAGVARGYLNRPELTAERFLADPFSDKPDARMYRTGDLVRYWLAGNLEFLGRNDQQVKIRGFRIEPGEIEARLAEHPAVRGSAVLAQGDGSEKRLVAYVVADVAEGLVNSLRAHLSAQLPDYMVPAAFVRLDSLPLTPNGKLDRRVLPAPDRDAFARQRYEAPQGETETVLAAIWCELLGIEQVSRHDNFFALGGHSLVAVRIINRIMAVLSVELPLAELFNSPSLTALAQAVQTWLDKQDSTALPAIIPVSREGILPLSFAQQRLWFLAQLEGISETYHIPLALHLRGQLNMAAWQQALNTVFARHEALRTVFVSADGQPQVRLLAKESRLPLVQYDLRGHSAADTALEQMYTEAVSEPFELSRGPLIRAMLIRLADEDYQFLLTLHHIVSDGWSVSVLIRELNALYTAFLTGQPDPLPPLTIQYPDYASWQHQWLSAERTQAQSDYWRSVLVDAPVLLDLPTDRPRPSEQSFAGQVVPVRLDPELTVALKHLSQQHGVTLFMTLLSAWAVVLSRLSGQEDIIIGTPSAGRSRQEVEPLIGFFINTLALRMAISGELTGAELLEQVRQTVLMAQAHQDLPFEQVVEIVQPPRQMAHTPLFQVMFAWQNNEHIDWVLPGLTVTPVDQAFDAVDTVKFDLELELYEEAGGISGALNYSTSLFDRPTIERHRDYLQTVLQAMVANAQQKVGEMDILAPAERWLLLETWNATETPYPETLCLHQLFEQQAEKTPDAIALVYEEQTFSYAELNARANQLAHQLIELGVEPEQRVAICVSRSSAMVVGVLAILKAGGAYVPLDPIYPADRLAYMLEDAAPVAVLTQTEWVDRLASTVPTVVLDAQAAFLMSHSTDNPDTQALGLTSHHLAYVIYTSGSTGLPKGVMNSHQALCNRLLWFVRDIVTAPLVAALKTNISFVDSVTEMLGVLLSGGKLVVFSDHEVKDLNRFSDGLRRFGVNYLVVVPSLLQHLIQGHRDELKSIRTLVCSGERLAPELARQVVTDYPWLRLLNFYGSSEVNGDAIWYEYNAQAGIPEVSVIGRPIANTQIYILDPIRQPVPLGVVGEIYIGGDGVANGYLNRLELTEARFLVDPFSDKPNARMYRTGDLARYLSDGNLEFLGRNDQQVKIRGFRIEPGEIEVRLAEHPAVHGSVVLALDDGTEKRLVAYVVADAEKELVNNLRTHLSSVLPDYMVPAAFVRLDSFPLTANGKLDRRALPAPDREAFARQRYEVPQGETETVLAAIWRELLGIEQVSRHDNFFALGGHSLLAVQMMNIAAGQGLSFTLNILFQFPVLTELAAKITSDPLLQLQSSAISVRSGGTGLPLFFVPSGMGDYSYVFGLSQHISSGYPIYVLPWPSINEGLMSTIEVLAIRMVTFIKVVQPTGPYRICGYSSGGVLAYAIAQQLLNAGEIVNFLGLIDTLAPHYFGKEAMQPKYHFFTELARQSEECPEKIAMLYQRIDELNLAQFIEAAQELALYPANLSADLMAKRWEQIEHYEQIVRDYEPPVLAVTLHQFYAMETYSSISFVTDKKLESLNIDPSLGWAQIISDTSLKLIAIPGDHFSLLENDENKIALVHALNMALVIDCDKGSV